MASTPGARGGPRSHPCKSRRDILCRSGGSRGEHPRHGWACANGFAGHLSRVGRTMVRRPAGGTGAVAVRRAWGDLGRSPVARTSAVLEHQGLSVDRDLRGAPGWEAGMAAWILRPRADFQSWQATLLGLGHDDAGSGATSLRSVLALGAR